MRCVYGWFFVLLHCFLLVLSGCTRIDMTAPRDELVVAMRDTPAFTQDGDGGPGFERELVESLAREMGLELRLILVRDHAELLTLLREGKAHMAASAMVVDGLTDIRYSAPLRRAEQLLVQSANNVDIDELADLAGKKIEVLDGSPEVVTLKEMSAWNLAKSAAGQPVTPPFLIAERHDLSEIDLLERVSERSSELAATDSLHYALAVNFFPDLQIAQKLPGEIRFAWAFPQGGDPVLYGRAQMFITRIQQDGTLARLNDRYFGHIHRLEQYSIAEFLKRIAGTLPRLRSHFITAQEMTGIDWRLLAALAYQESMWDPLATSPTNVRGIMMLTEETADHLNVSNRLDARQSILAGARYLSEIIDALPRDIPQPDRTWLGMAAYNLGQGHMNGALGIARTLKRDTRSWYEMKQVLPLMARPEYYKRLKSGRARGGEAVIMVENIRKFYDILARFEAQHPAEKLSLGTAEPPSLPLSLQTRLPVTGRPLKETVRAVPREGLNQRPDEAGSKVRRPPM